MSCALPDSESTVSYRHLNQSVHKLSVLGSHSIEKNLLPKYKTMYL